MKIKFTNHLFRQRKELLKFIMRTFIFLLCSTAFGFTSGDIFSQNTKIRIDKDQVVSIDAVFDLLRDQTDYTFIYQEDLFKDAPKVQLKKGTIRANKLLETCFSGKGFKLDFKGNKIVIIAADSSSADQQTFTVTGTITDKDGVPLPGASVVVVGTTTGAQTDFDGNFSITVPEEGVLEITYIGYSAQRFTITKDEDLQIQLQEDLASLDEVVVIGYGTAVKKDLTGAVSSFDQKAVNRQPGATDVSELMRGAVPGLNVGTSTGPSGNSRIIVRGITSFSTDPNDPTFGANNVPLLVVDDVIFQGSISSINPADIASVNVLKDASAAAVYGSRAASGVIIITTKKGTTGKPTINVRSAVGFAHAGIIEEVYGPGEYLDYKGEVFDVIDGGNELGYYQDPNNLPDGVTLNDWLEYDGLGGTQTSPSEIWLDRLEMSDVEKQNFREGNILDWRDIIFQAGLRTNNTISVSGKTENVSYYTSLGHVSNEGILLFEKDETLRGRLNLEMKISDFLSAGVNLQAFTRTAPTQLPNRRQAYDRQSPYGSLFYDDGEFRHLPYDDALASNPFLWEYRDNSFKQRELFTNIFAKVKLPYGFSYRVNWSNRANYVQDYRFRPVIATLGDGGDVGSRRDQFSQRWMVDNILNWNKTFGDVHNFDVTFLFNIEEAETFNSFQSNSEFSPNDKLSFNNLALGANPVLTDDNTADTRSTADAVMGRLSYNLLDRYYLTATVRRDGYSAFGVNNPRATFPSLSLGWRLSDEGFMEKADFINNLKLRASWGKNGNRDIGVYSALSRLQGVPYIYDQSTVIGVNASELANLDLKWETTESYNAGLDFGLFGSRISGSIDAYYSLTDDLLLQRSLPRITGFDDVFANLGEVENKGLEVALNTVNIDNDNFRWSSSVVFSFNRNKIKSLYGDIVDVLDDDGNVIGQREEDDIENDWYIGHAIDEIFDYKIVGVWQLGEEEEAETFGRVPGDFKLLDVNDDGIIDFDDQVFQGNRLPQYRASLRNDFVYKNFDLSIFANALLDYKGVNNEHFNFRTQQQRLNKIKTPYWTEDNPTNEWARLDSKNSSPGTNWYDDRSFIRIQNITLGYTFPKTILDKFNIKSLRFYANVQNLPAFSLGGWEYHWDVETRAPTPVLTAFGLDLSF